MCSEIVEREVRRKRMRVRFIGKSREIQKVKLREKTSKKWLNVVRMQCVGVEWVAERNTLHHP